MSHFFYKGEIVAKKHRKSSRNIKKSFENGDLDGMYNYACVLFNCKGVKSNINQSIEYLKTLAIEKEHLNAMNTYGLILLKGKGIPIDFETELYFIKTADAMFQV